MKFKKKDIPKLKYGIIHSQFGMADGVSIVMKQVEEVMIKELRIPKSHIYYLVGKNKAKGRGITQRDIMWDKHPTNLIALKQYSQGLGGEMSEKIETTITLAKQEIEQFVSSHDIDVLIAHNACHPVNFISSVALSRFYRDRIAQKQKTPKYLLWWHDSHRERDFYLNPSFDINEYLLQGVPGPFVEYILFINSLQIRQADSYFQTVESRNIGFYETVQANHDVIYNTTDTFISNYKDLKHTSRKDVEFFLEKFNVQQTLSKKGYSLKDAVFCLQHTRIVERKRIDVALEYCHALLKELKHQQKAKCLYFFISGYDHDGITQKLKRLNTKLCKEYKQDVFFVCKKNKGITFEEFPRIFAKLGGFTTYFSEIEGFGNNLLEVLASGLIPVVYTYPVFKQDIEQFKFNLIAVEEMTPTKKSITDMIDILFDEPKRKKMVNQNIKLLKKHLSHTLIKHKLTRAIIRKRLHT